MIVLLDCDGVVCNCSAGCLAIISELTGRQYGPSDHVAYDFEDLLESPEQTAEFWRRFDAPGFCASLQPFPGAVEAVRELMAVHDVCFVTSPAKGSITWAGERAVWLQEHFGATRKQIVSTSAKHRVYGDVLVDDSPEHLTAWAEVWRSGTPLCWHQPYNVRATAYRRVRDWIDVRAALNAIEVRP